MKMSDSVISNNKRRNVRRERFVRLSKSRTNKILDMLHILGHCANIKNYEYTPKDINEIFTVIEAKVKETERKFGQVQNTKDKIFIIK